jgi:hypothetical protein
MKRLTEMIFNDSSSEEEEEEEEDMLLLHFEPCHVFGVE